MLRVAGVMRARTETILVGECPLCEQEIEIYMSELGKIKGCDREVIKSWDDKERL